ncbi:MAG: diguanylate cyclase, partial [Spirochaetaceae bacterium]|nr:diguanylate cyclase [Spirochaetaceae bacterium]
MEKKIRTNLRISLEILIILLIIFFSNFFLYPENPGFLSGPFNPYSALVVIAAAYYGKKYGFVSYFLALILIMVPVNREIPLTAYWELLWKQHYIRLTILLVGVYILGMIRDSYTNSINHYRTTTKKEVFEKFKYKNEVTALKAVNNELEERVLRQSESVTTLYTQIKALHTQSLTESLNILLSTVNKFSWAEKASIWKYDQNSLQLVMIANIGWDSSDLENSILDIENSIEGWCYRNNLTFSIRMLLEYENLRKMDKKRNIFTFPINFSNNSWGVLNIEEMPFTKYNLYIEKILSILVDLAAPEIERAVEYESVVAIEEINGFTGLPAYTQLYTMIDKNIDKALAGNHTFSIILIEFENFEEQLQKFGEDKSYKLLVSLSEKLNLLSGNKIDFFHYKEANQLAIFYPDIDYDGVSLFCLETLGIINNTIWKINDTTLVLDAILGYSSFGHQKIPVEEMLAVAENLLEMQ